MIEGSSHLPEQLANEPIPILWHSAKGFIGSWVDKYYSHLPQDTIPPDLMPHISVGGMIHDLGHNGRGFASFLTTTEPGQQTTGLKKLFSKPSPEVIVRHPLMLKGKFETTNNTTTLTLPAADLLQTINNGIYSYIAKEQAAWKKGHLQDLARTLEFLIQRTHEDKTTLQMQLDELPHGEKTVFEVTESLKEIATEESHIDSLNNE